VSLIRGNAPVPAPLTKPKTAGKIHGNVPDDLGDM
jgi:glutathione-regulated potassium-efflux system protein KefB